MKDFYMSKLWRQVDLPYDEDLFYSEKLISPVKKIKDWPKSFKENNSTILQEEINENGFRSNSFTDSHNGKHLLFAGCSYTWGTGLSIEEVWSKKLYNLISNKNKCSGFFNLGVPGQSIMDQIFYIFKYCKIYGNPNYIFFNIPDLGRFHDYDDNQKLFYYAAYKDDKILNALSYQYYFMLEEYCLKNNIELYSFSWCDSESFNKKSRFGLNKTTNSEILKKFKTFYSITIEETLSFVFDYKEKNKNMQFLELARDKDHLGIAYHEYWSNFIFEKYKLKNKI
jgi:hypothetical protein